MSWGPLSINENWAGIEKKFLKPFLCPTNPSIKSHFLKELRGGEERFGKKENGWKHKTKREKTEKNEQLEEKHKKEKKKHCYIEVFLQCLGFWSSEINLGSILGWKWFESCFVVWFLVWNHCCLAHFTGLSCWFLGTVTLTASGFFSAATPLTPHFFFSCFNFQVHI